MGKISQHISDKQQAFIAEQHIFFVASAPLSDQGHVNLSPKGLDSFRVLSPNRVAYMDLISSGNETSAHLLENGRITFMFCSFKGSPNILRLYGRGSTVLPDHPEWAALSSLFDLLPSTRQIIVAEIMQVQSSCGYGVPLLEFAGERDQHLRWADTLGPAGLAAYREENNLRSLDGLPTALALDGET